MVRLLRAGDEDEMLEPLPTRQRHTHVVRVSLQKPPVGTACVKRMYLCVCTFPCAFVSTSTHVYICMHMYVCMHACICVHECTYVRTYACKCLCACVVPMEPHTRARARTDAHPPRCGRPYAQTVSGDCVVYMHACIHACMHMLLHVHSLVFMPWMRTQTQTLLLMCAHSITVLLQTFHVIETFIHRPSRTNMYTCVCTYRSCI